MAHIVYCYTVQPVLQLRPRSDGAAVQSVSRLHRRHGASRNVLEGVTILHAKKRVDYRVSDALLAKLLRSLVVNCGSDLWGTVVAGLGTQTVHGCVVSR